MDIANEDDSVPLPLRFGRPETRESVRPQVHTVAIAHSSEFYVARHMGHTEGERHGQAEDWYEPTVRKHHGSFS